MQSSSTPVEGRTHRPPTVWLQRHLLSMLLVSVQLYNPIKHVLVCYSSSSMIRMRNQTAMFLYHQIRPRYRHYPWGITVLPAIYLTRCVWGRNHGRGKWVPPKFSASLLHFQILHCPLAVSWRLVILSYTDTSLFLTQIVQLVEACSGRIIAWFLPLEH